MLTTACVPCWPRARGAQPRTGRALRQHIPGGRQAAVHVLVPPVLGRARACVAARPSARRRECGAELGQQRGGRGAVELGRGDAEQLRRQLARCRPSAGQAQTACSGMISVRVCDPCASSTPPGSRSRPTSSLLQRSMHLRGNPDEAW